MARAPGDRHDGLREAFADAERTLGAAFARAVGRHGYAVPEPEVDGYFPETGEWRIGWWLPLPDGVGTRGYECFRCELDVDNPSFGAVLRPLEVEGWVSADYYVGRGVTNYDEVYRTPTVIAETHDEVAAALRHLAAELAGQLDHLDLTQFLTRRPDG